MTKLTYLKRSVASQFSPDRFRCPNCGKDESDLVDRKYVFTQLRRCKTCRLMFRTPTDVAANNESFYENEYKQGFTTAVPTDAELAELKDRNFEGTEKSYSYYIAVLSSLGVAVGSKLFDFGCSWGYGSYQLAQAGFDVTAYEVAPSRRNYARQKLAVRAVDDMKRAVATDRESVDCFFSAHVLEHVPAPAEAFAYAMGLLKPGGVFVCFTPNGSNSFRVADSDWKKLWGEVHPNFIDDEFLDHSFSRSPRVTASSPVSDVCLPDAASLVRANSLQGSELFFAARKIGTAWA